MKFRKKKRSTILLFIIFIFAMSLLNVNYIGKIMTDRVSIIYSDIIEKNFYNSIRQTYTGQVISNDELKELVNVSVNDKNEIMYMDYDYKNVNSFLKEQLNGLFSDLENTNLNSNYYEDNLGVLMVPIGISTNNVLFSDLGPKIPCKLNVLNNIDMEIKTRIMEYGINNSLIEVFLLINIKSSIINPIIDNKFVKDYEIMICSKIIEGRIPTYYGGVIEKSSAIVSS